MEGSEGTAAGAEAVQAELEAVLTLACGALEAQEQGRLQDAVQGYFMARARVHYVAEALLAPLVEEVGAAAPADAGGGPLALAQHACGLLAATYGQAIERLSGCGGGVGAGTQLSEEEGSADADVGTHLGGGGGGGGGRPLGIRVGSGGSGGGQGGVPAVAQRCLREVSGSLDDVVGLAAIKQELREAVLLPLALPHLFTGIRRPQSNMVFYGVPGTGKTMLAEKVAAEARLPLLALSPSSILSKWAGESEKSVRAVFEAAAAMSPAIIFIDEVDALAPTRSSGDDLAARRVLTELLLQMTAAASRPGAPVWVLAATNRLQDCDPALLRRFDRKVEVPPPDCEARAAFFAATLARPELAGAALSEEEIARLAELTEGATGSDLAVLCREAAMAPLRELMRDGGVVELQQAGAAAAALGGPMPAVRAVRYEDFEAAAAKLQAA